LKVINRSKGIVVSESAKLASSFFSRFRGLMFSRKKDTVLVSPEEDIASSSIHMFFMGFPIDVIWLNSDRVVIDLKKSVLPFNPVNRKTWRIYKPRKAARYVIELGLGNSGGTEIGDVLEFENSQSTKC
jgi:uncharacterized membrane protein (UPF0127 family)